MSINDYGFELLAAEPSTLQPLLDAAALFADGDLLHDVLASLNSQRAGAAALSRDRARRRAGVHRLPGRAEEHASSCRPPASLFFEVFRKYDAGNLLLAQAEREVLAQELEIRRLRATL